MDLAHPGTVCGPAVSTTVIGDALAVNEGASFTGRIVIVNCLSSDAAGEPSSVPRTVIVAVPFASGAGV
jgi:hypothetical protein